ncbi:MAG: AAA family ATPase [bacterium]
MPAQSIAILSNKGGVGKTHISTNLALLLAQHGKRVLLVDADWSTGNVARKLGVNTQRTFQHYFRGECRIGDLITQAPQNRNLYYVPGSPGEYEVANMTPDQHERVVATLKAIVEAARGEFVIVDLGAGIDMRTLDIALSADQQIIVSTPQDVLAGYGGAKALLHRYFALMQDSPAWFVPHRFSPSILINMVMEAGTGRAVAATMRNLLLSYARTRFIEQPELWHRLQDRVLMAHSGTPGIWGEARITPGIESFCELIYLGEIPYARDRFIKAEMERTPFIQLYPTDPATRALTEIAERILGIPPRTQSERVLGGFFERLVRRPETPRQGALRGAH